MWNKLKTLWEDGMAASQGRSSPFCMESDALALPAWQLRDWPLRWRAWAGRQERGHLLLEGPAVGGVGTMYHILGADDGYWIWASFLEMTGTGRRYVLPWEWMIASDWSEPPRGDVLRVMEELEAAEVPYGNMAAIRGDHRIPLEAVSSLLRRLAPESRPPRLVTMEHGPLLWLEDTAWGNLPHAGEAQLRAMGLIPPPELFQEHSWRLALGKHGGEDGWAAPWRYAPESP
jgi:hypothetical protein